MKSSYEHQPLTLPNSIRVLTLEPATSPKAPLECSLSEVDLDNITPSSSYEALSYVWGERVGTIPILCHGKQLLVTPNCRDALLGLRKPYKRRRLFIDAICIDQRQEPSSVLERGRQIELMGRVYELAHTVVIWLDQSHPAMPRFFRFLRLLNWATENIKRGDAAKIENAYHTLSQNDWFKRVWTLQEQAFANPKTSIIVCGHHQISCETLEKTHGQLIYAGVGDHTLFSIWEMIELRIGISRAVRLFNEIIPISEGLTGHNKKVISSPLLRVDGMWKAVQNLDSTIPQDKIFGVYGIFGRLGLNPTPNPNSSMALADVFEATTRGIIRMTNSLHIIGMCSREVCITEGLPSWVPDWIMKWPDPSGAHMDGYAITRWKGRHISERNSDYDATKNTSLMVREFSSKGMLNLRGAIIGKVDILDVSATIGSYRPNGDTVILRDYLQACRIWCKTVALFPTYCNGSPTIDAVAQVLLLHQGEKTIESMQKDQTLMAREFSEWFDLMLYPDCKNHQLKQRIERDIRQIRLSNPEIDPESHFARGFHVCKEDDVVALLAGYEFPVALRPDGGGNYRFVAPLYVHGIMHGEAWPEDESELEEIVLV
ncbi:heterokaryon incompatibility protein-domain-containing protein [Xylaria digitata]|nr:heterokaryon incompatibility protein-domain-containing protein [Xylaria digitata]